MEKTLIVWRRFGREHGEDQGFRENPPDVVASHLQSRVERFRDTPEEEWLWYKVSDDLLIEKKPSSDADDPTGYIYYLPKRNWIIIENASFESLPDWPWYIHIGKTEYRDDLSAWVFTDLFADVIVRADEETHSVLDLNDLASIAELGLVEINTLTDILRDTQSIVDDIRRGKFPPEELADRAAIIRELGWD